MSGIRLTLNGRGRNVDAPPSTTLLDWLRESEHLTGTKEGCAEGDCGACTVVVDGRAVNACITLMGQVHGRSVTTVEGLLGPGREAHPVQHALAKTDGTQCGFCTPGFIMSLYALQRDGGAKTAEDVHEALAGNLCRCTGYRPIVETAVALPAATAETFASPPGGSFAGGGQRYEVPESLPALLDLRAKHPDAVLLAGATDLGLGPSRSRAPIRFAIDLTRVPELQVLEDGADRLTIGAALSYTEAMPALAGLHPTIRPYFTRLGSRQIRNAGTIGGNLGTASPIGDTPPLLLALDAELTLASTRGERRVAIADFFLGYRKTALAADEVIVAIHLPKLKPGALFRIDKLSKRYDQDISTVAAAFRLTLAGGKVTDARLAFGGMAAAPVRAKAAEAALVGKPFDVAAVETAVIAIGTELTPIGDMRATARYRSTVAGNLLRRFLLAETSPGIALEVATL